MNLSTETPNGATKAKPAVEAAPVRKFMFERSFEDAAIVHRAQERKPVLMKPEQIDALKKESHDTGFAAGKNDESASQTAHLAAVMTKVEQNLVSLMQNLEALAREQETHTRAMVLAVAKKILPDFAAKNGFQEIEALLNDTIREMAREPRLVVRVSESEFETLNERVQAIATQRAYAGKVIVLVDPDVAAGDCRIEWPDGGIERNTQTNWNAIEQTISPST
jgi:flagellar assembly protein FliH